MLPLDYASESEDESERNSAGPSSEKPAQSSAQLKKAPARNGSLLGLALPPPKAKKVAGPKKIVVELPKLEKRGSEDEGSLSDDMPVTKKPKLGGKSGPSGLLSMLPAPKKSTLELPTPKRVLGGGRPGVVYSASTKTESVIEQRVDETALDTVEKETVFESAADEDTITSLIPPSMLLKGKGKPSNAEKPKPQAPSADAVDFFSLGVYRTMGSHRG